MDDAPTPPSTLAKALWLLLALALGLGVAWFCAETGRWWIAPIAMLAIAIALGGLLRRAGWTRGGSR